MKFYVRDKQKEKINSPGDHRLLSKSKVIVFLKLIHG